MIHEAQFTLNRRQFFGQSGLRMGGIAMPLMLGQSLSGRASAASEVHSDTQLKNTTAFPAQPCPDPRAARF